MKLPLRCFVASKLHIPAWKVPGEFSLQVIYEPKLFHPGRHGTEYFDGEPPPAPKLRIPERMLPPIAWKADRDQSPCFEIQKRQWVFLRASVDQLKSTSSIVIVKSSLAQTISHGLSVIHNRHVNRREIQ